MILYHGTNERLAKVILKDRVILSNPPEHNFEGDVSKNKYILPNTHGYIYLTNKLSKAAHYGSITTRNEEFQEHYAARYGSKDKPKSYVFKVEIEKEELEFDFDEEKVVNMDPSAKKITEYTVEQSLEALNSTRIKRNLNLGVNVIEYAIFEMGDWWYIKNGNSVSTEWIKL
ncbi:MAG TPA: hypothetical protein IAA29_00145 [Candidatus Paenibacillus intestinavium]|nr:hypothetical protein [Candidatus Paenibacillus intestinavium]